MSIGPLYDKGYLDGYKVGQRDGYEQGKEDAQKRHREYIAECDDVCDEHEQSAYAQGKAERKKGCELCRRGKPIKAFTVLPECGLQYGESVMANYCPMCGRKLGGHDDA